MLNLSIHKNDTLIIKGIGILFLLFIHIFEYIDYNTIWMTCAKYIGGSCVSLFVLLSGYGLSVGYQRINDDGGGGKSPSQSMVLLLIRRLMKFYMNYWMIFLLFVPLGVLVFGRPLEMAYPEGNNVIRCLIWDIFAIGGPHSYNITWYFNKIIVILYILSPIVLMFSKQSPVLFIIAIFMMQRLKVLDGTYMLNIYLMPFTIGCIWAIYGKKLKIKLARSRWIYIIIALALLSGIVYCQYNKIGPSYLEWDIYSAVLIIFLTIQCKPYRFKIDNILVFLGKHSMNIFMIHTFVYYYFWHEEIYALGNPILIYLAVLLISMVFSIIIEIAKNQLNFYQLPEYLICKYQNMRENKNINLN